ncbi:unnamed protein product [Arctia plantaginis]|uniref:PiggyBac transposable element-derived protein domain-containing protein n=1 Tax=Arctia plantaginis TaxID=874455 RepID=A0A8S0ZK65_ARCPL|nr:unnamed protein product [Arctia plantaginis]
MGEKHIAFHLNMNIAAIRSIFDSFVQDCQKAYIPHEYMTIDEMLWAFRGKQPASSMFGFQRDVSIVSYAPKKNKVVILMSTLHHDDLIDVTTGDKRKPEMKVIQPKETINNVTIENNNTESDNNTESENQKNNNEGGNESLETNSIETHDTMATKRPIPNRVPKRSLKNMISPVDAKMMKFMDSYSNHEPKKMNRHLSFFNGILPSLDKYDDDEALEFQMSVLQLMKKIKNSRQIRESSSFNLPSVHRGYLHNNTKIVIYKKLQILSVQT